MSSSSPTVRLEHPLVRGIEVPKGELWEFPEGLIGLPDFRRFVLVSLEGCEPFEFLGSVEDPTLGFVLVDPIVLVVGYVPELAAEDLAPLDLKPTEAVDVRVPVVLPAPDQPLSLNLKGPIVLAPTRRTGVQRISRSDEHSVRYVPQPTDSGAASCSS